jgi:predicted ATPase/DNA-binding SARP family transcriptional activator
LLLSLCALGSLVIRFQLRKHLELLLLRLFQGSQFRLQRRHFRVVNGFQRGDLALLYGDLAVIGEILTMLFLKFVEQHRGEQVIVDGEGLARFIVLHQIRVDLGHLFGNQPILKGMRAALGAVLVAEGDRAQAHQLVSDGAHILDVVLEAAGRGQCSQLPAGVDVHSDPSAGGDSADAGDVGGLLAAAADANDPGILGGPGIANLDVVAAGGQGLTGAIPQGNIAATRSEVIEGIVAIRVVVVTCRVVEEAIVTIGGVVVTGRVEVEGQDTVGGVVVTRRVGVEGIGARSDRDTDRSFLAGTFWPDVKESQALFYLRRSLSELRQVLGPDAARLISPTPRTLRLDPEGMEVDVLSFDAAIARGDAASLETAVDLYHGDLLEDCDEAFALPEREARREAYVTALQRLALMKVAAAPATAVAYLRRAAGIDPLNEALQRALMEALTQSGDFAAVQQSYREFRQRLQEEFQSEPDPETVALYYRLREQVRQTTPTLCRISAHLFPTATSQTRDGNAALLPPTNLPRSLTSFIGREKEKVEVKRLLQQGPLITLIGMGGSGKTRLSLEVADEVLANYPDGVWLVELASLSDPTLVAQTVAMAVDIREKAGTPLLQTLIGSLQSKRTLLVMDNCEHVVPACADLVNSLLRSCPQVSVLASSREALGITGEQLFRVPCLALPTPQQALSLERLLEYEAIRLFVERAVLVRPDFVVTTANTSAVVSVCHRLDGLPLALELAAARVRGMGVEVIQTRLDDRFHLLTGGSRTALPRHQTLRALIDWSYDLLSEAEQVLLARASVFAGGWTLEAAERVAGEAIGAAEPLVTPTSPVTEILESPWTFQLLIPTDDVLDLLLSLVDKSLVLVEEQGGITRYRLLETVQAYARERLEASNETERIGARHREWCAEFMETANPRLWGVEAAIWLDRVEAEQDNLRLALAGGNDLISFRIAGAMWWFWYVKCYWTEGREYLVGLLETGETGVGHTKERALALRGAGVLTRSQGDYSTSQVWFERALEIYRDLDQRQDIAHTLNSLGNMAYSQGDPIRARVFYEESLGIFRVMADPSNVASTLGNLGMVAIDQGDYAEARKLCEESLALCKVLGDRRDLASALNSLGKVAHMQGDYRVAHSHLQESLEISREIRDPRFQSFALANLGRVAKGQGDYGVARALHEESLAICREIGDRHGMATLFQDLGTIAADQGDCGTARVLYEQSLGIHRELGTRQGVALSIECLAGLCVVEGNAVTAARLWGAAEALREEIRSPLLPDEREGHDRAVAELRRAMGEEAFSAAWQEGRGMTVALCNPAN